MSRAAADAQPTTIPQPTMLLGVTGCIAAYKACELLRLLQKAGVRVKVVMTPMAAEFVGPATFKALSGEEVAIAPIDDPARPIHHVSLAEESDLFVIAPATANTLNKLANGVGDNLLTTTALATAAPIIAAPAMNVHMWRNEITQESIQRLRERGVMIIEPDSGYLACGDFGEGRLAEPAVIAEAVLAELHRAHDLHGKTLLITAGPTCEHLDPARYLSNPSSGKTGYAIAEEAARRGAKVLLVSGPTELPDPFDCEVVRVNSAEEMFAATQKHFAAARPDAAIFTAAVADFRPANYSEQKLKKAERGSTATLELVANPDILATLAATKDDTYIVGFAAETTEVISAARNKLETKNADLIVANDVSNPALGFASAHNRWHFVSRDGLESTDVLPKKGLANMLLDKIAGALRGGEKTED